MGSLRLCAPNHPAAGLPRGCARDTAQTIPQKRHDLRHRLQILAGMVERDEKTEALGFLGTACSYEAKDG